MRCSHGQVVDVDLAALLLELAQFIGAEGAGYFAAIECRQCDEAVAAEQGAQVGGAGPLARVGVRVAEGRAEEVQHGVHEGGVGGAEPADHGCR